MAFELTFRVAWAHLDANGHMANTAYLDLAVDVRFSYFESRGFPPTEFRKQGFGPVVRTDQIDYHRELQMLQPVRVTFLMSGLSDDCSRFRLLNEFWREDGALAARLTTTGGWLDLKARKLIAPPETLAAALRDLERAPDFATLESSVKATA